VSHLLEILGRGLEHDLGDVLDRYYWSPGRFSQAELEDRCIKTPKDSEVHLQLALVQMRASQTDLAIAHLKQACRYAPDYLAARLAIASACTEKGLPAEAMEHLRIAWQTHPGETPVLLAMGYCHEKLGQAEKAAECYRDVIARDEKLLVARERLAALAVFLNHPDEAIDQYEALRKERPEDSWVRSALAHLYYRAGRHGEAIREFETAIAMEPENWALVDDEVEALAADGHVREAIERLHGLIEEQGPFADLLVRLADLYGRVGDDEAATTHYQRALDIQPTYIEAAVKLGTQHLTGGRWDEAAESFQTACELNDRLLVNYVGMGVANLAAGRRDDGLNCFELARAIEPNSTLLLTEMARLQLKAAVAEDFLRNFEVGQGATSHELDLDNDDLLDKQIEQHAAQIEREPEYADLRYRYGVLLRAQGRLGEAAEEFAKAVELNPGYVSAIIKLGITQQDLGRVNEAVETFTKALELKPDYVDLHYRLGLLHTDRKNFAEAAQHLELAAKHAPDNRRLQAFLAMSLQNMGLMDRAAATWRSLWRIHQAARTP
jgi:superkiller protein 3